jgi:hypothetical protein
MWPVERTIAAVGPILRSLATQVEEVRQTIAIEVNQLRSGLTNRDRQAIQYT